jgi:hypothetical protein
MLKHTARLLSLALLACPLACLADSSYQQSTQITGGQFIDSIKNIPFLSKKMKSLTDPTITQTIVHGNIKAVVNKDSTEITDLDKEVIIHIDNDKKSYSVMTFADMRKMMAELPQKMAQMQQQMKDEQAKAQKQPGQAVPPNLQFNFTVSVTDPGPSKIVNGQNARQQIMTMKMTVTDTNNPGTNITYTMTTEIWTTPEVPAEMKEVRDFDMRFGQKLMAGMNMTDMLAEFQGMRSGANGAMAQMFGGKPGAADAFAQMQKEMAKIKGTRILEITRMSGSGTGMQSTNGSGNGSSGSNSGGGTGQGGSGNGSQPAQDNSRLGVLGSALGGSLNPFHKKKADPPPDQSQTAQPASQSQGDVTMMEMTTQTMGFSQQPVSTSVFQIPPGFKQVPSPMEQMMQK